METTKLFDKHDQELFVGDKVIKQWVWAAQEDNKILPFYKVHTIIRLEESPSPNTLVVNYYLGNSRNRWKGEEVEKVFNFERHNIPEDSYFYLEFGKPIIATGKELLGMNSVEYEKIKNIFDETERYLMWGNTLSDKSKD